MLVSSQISGHFSVVSFVVDTDEQHDGLEEDNIIEYIIILYLLNNIVWLYT